MKQFGRQWSLSIYSEKEAILVDQLKISFDITKSTDSTPNPATIKVWNMTRAHIEQALNGDFKNIALSVGYNELCLIFKGDISKTKVERDGVDSILNFECADGFKAYTDSRIMLTLPRGADDKAILKHLGATLKNVTEGATEVPNKRKLPRGKVLNGDSRKLLDNVAKNNNADWSIQDGKLVFIPKGAVLNDKAFLLSQETGMVGLPEKTDKGLDVKCLLNPRLKIGGQIEVKSMFKAFNGLYKIVKIQHSGTGGDGDWLSRLSVVKGEFKKMDKPKSTPKKPLEVKTTSLDQKQIDGFNKLSDEKKKALLDKFGGKDSELKRG